MKIVNHKTPSIDGKGIMMGRPAYTDDLADPNSLIIKILRSPHAFAKIKSIDTTKAKELKGVEIVLTHLDVPKRSFTRAGQGYPEPSPHDKFILDEYVRYVGDEVACVAAINNDIATKALKLIEVEYEVLEPVLDFEKAIDILRSTGAAKAAKKADRETKEGVVRFSGGGISIEWLPDGSMELS